ncbi:MAG: hypothetical protein M3321_02520, partial [Actinomycetota bacterium]|nr:hypothetical protein [Actinomycetota bacterium]
MSKRGLSDPVGRRLGRRRERERRLRFGDDDRTPEQLRNPAEVVLEDPQHRRRVERRRRVVERVEEDAVAAERRPLLLPVNARNPGRLPGQQLRGEV